MIKDVNLIKNKSVSFIKEFINNCTIEEKIDTHYVIVEITSKQTITIKKSSGKVIDRIDMILNNMWSQLVTDWNYIRLANYDLFSTHVGYCISMFYFPNNKPLLTEYKSDVKYLIDRVVFNDELVNSSNFINNLRLKDKFHISVKKYINKKLDNNILNSINGETKDNINYNEIFDNIVSTNKDNIVALDKPEGYIFKWKKYLYQRTFNVRDKIIPEKTQYEYLLCDFISYCKNNNYQDKIYQSYVKTVCVLFNDYIINWENKRHNIENNIDVNSIQSPTLGTTFDMGYEYIPDAVTLNICKMNDLYKSIFKVLLANLRKGKDNNQCIYMNKKQVDDWNNIMKNIKIRTLVI